MFGLAEAIVAPEGEQNHAGRALAHVRKFQEVFEAPYGSKRRPLWNWLNMIVPKVYNNVLCSSFWKYFVLIKFYASESVAVIFPSPVALEAKQESEEELDSLTVCQMRNE